MNSELLSIIGIDGIDPGYYVIAIVVLLLLVLILLIVLINQSKKIRKLSLRVDALCKGKSAESLEEEINDIISDNRFLMSAVSEHKNNIKEINRRMTRTYQKMGLVKYDAFRQMGGKLSFALALLDERNNGFLINSVHSADGCYSYTKEIVGGECELTLGNEEAEAVKLAIEEKPVQL